MTRPVGRIRSGHTCLGNNNLVHESLAGHRPQVPWMGALFLLLWGPCPVRTLGLVPGGTSASSRLVVTGVRRGHGVVHSTAAGPYRRSQIDQVAPAILNIPNWHSREASSYRERNVLFGGYLPNQRAL